MKAATTQNTYDAAKLADLGYGDTGAKTVTLSDAEVAKLAADVDGSIEEIEGCQIDAAAAVSPADRVKDLVSWETTNDFRAVDLVKEWANSKDASIDGGDIWIADPQVGHWLSDTEIEEFLAWVEAQKDA